MSPFIADWRITHTRIGDDCYLMNYAHVAHDCQLGKGVIMANSATLSWSCHRRRWHCHGWSMCISSICAYWKLCMVSGMTGSRMDLPPYVILDGLPPAIRGLNLIGMRRHKFSPKQDWL